LRYLFIALFSLVLSALLVHPRFCLRRSDSRRRTRRN